MLVAAQNPPVVLHSQTQTTTTTSSKRQLDAYQITQVPVPTQPLPPPVIQVVPASPVDPGFRMVPIPVRPTVPLPATFAVPVRTVQAQEQVPVSPHERLLAAQLAHLASQHHTSEYNRHKFGPKGAPVVYMPLSLQAPGQVRELRAKQARNAGQKAWWVSERNACDSLEKPLCLIAMDNTDEKMLPTTVNGPSEDISQEISAAISSQMTMTYITKTSQSHPINISLIIPPDALPAISSRLVAPPESSPVMFHLPENCYLDRLTSAPAHGPFRRLWNQLRLPSMRLPVPVTWTQRGTSELQNALNAELGFLPQSSFVISHERHGIRPPTDLPPPSIEPLAVPLPPSPPRGGVRRRPRYGRATSAPPAFRMFKGMQRRGANHKEQQRQCLQRNSRSSPEVATKRLDDGAPPIVNPDGSETPELDELSNNATGLGLVLPPAYITPSLSPRAAPSLFMDEPAVPVQRLGNLYLSSCPGKKVRLSGPVKGRSAICRDLRSDLSRFKELGVGCVICCLDDTELDFLGASWGEYSSVANELGLDILRIPMPEGFAPLSPASFDSQLKRVIEEYTLRGVPVLAHCRGGVGRAGVFACCWMLKLGLCGWKDWQICARSCSNHAPPNSPAVVPNDRQMVNGNAQMDTQTQPVQASPPDILGATQNTSPAFENVPRICRATLHLLERVLAVVRRRRSLKAVETYEQVLFLVHFIEYLDAEARHGTS